jgi:hypothetical protein
MSVIPARTEILGISLLGALRETGRVFAFDKPQSKNIETIRRRIEREHYKEVRREHGMPVIAGPRRQSLA